MIQIQQTTSKVQTSGAPIHEPIVISVAFLVFVVCLAAGTWGVSESWGGDVPASDSDPSVPKLRR